MICIDGNEKGMSNTKDKCISFHRYMAWTTHQTDDGKTYYYNTETKVSSWTDPEAKTGDAKEPQKAAETAAKKINEFSGDGNFMEQVIGKGNNYPPHTHNTCALICFAS